MLNLTYKPNNKGKLDSRVHAIIGQTICLILTSNWIGGHQSHTLLVVYNRNLAFRSCDEKDQMEENEHTSYICDFIWLVIVIDESICLTRSKR